MIARRTAAFKFAARGAALGAAALAAAGCGGGRWISTHSFDDPPPVVRRGSPVAATGPASVAGGGARSDGAVTPAGFAPQEFGAGEEGSGIDEPADAGQFDGLNEDGGLTPFDPSAAPSAGPLETGVGDAPSAGPLQTETGDAPSSGPLQTGEPGGVGPDGGDLGSAPGAGTGAGTADPDAAADALGAAGLGAGGSSAVDPPAGDAAGDLGTSGTLPTPLVGGRPGAGDDADGDDADGPNPPDLDRPTPEPGPELQLKDVTAAVLAAYPSLTDAALGRPLADGLVLEAKGAFDTKLKASQELAPLGFYENYRHAVGVEQPLFGGGDLFAGYRIGRGEFEPWYQERQTNDGGEFKAGFTVPLLRNRRIDARRAAVRVAALERAAADPAVAAVQLAAVRDGSAAYWEWVAAGRLRSVAERLLDLSLDRTEGLEAQVEAGEKAAITLQFNDRLIAARRSKLLDADRKFRQAAAKLSLYLRDPAGVPLIPEEALLPARLPEPGGDLPPVEALVGEALGRRPELTALALQREQAVVALSEAKNDLLPDLDAGLVISQDVGGLSSPKGDKQPFELDTALVFSVPLQRRKALGKAQQVEAKLARLAVKRRFAAEKAGVEVRLAYAALEAARGQTEQAEIGVDLAERLRAAEVRAFELGESDLLRLNLQEASAASAAESLVAARFDYWVALADLAAATAASPLAPPGLYAPPPADADDAAADDAAADDAAAGDPPPAPIPAPMPPPAAG